MIDKNYHVYVDKRHVDCPIGNITNAITSGIIRIDTYEDDNKVRADAFYVLAVSEDTVGEVVTELGRIDCSLDFTQLTKFIMNECDTLVVYLPDANDDESVVADDYYFALVRTDSFSANYRPYSCETVLTYALATICDPQARIVNANLPYNKYHWAYVHGTQPTRR